jgi:glycosyltransferase involved in cell wall biosynthesis
VGCIDGSRLAGALARLKVLLFANTEWYLYNFRLSLARALQEAGAEVLLISPPGPYGAKLAKAGFRWIPLPMDRRSLNPLRELRLLLLLIRLYRREHPDVVHHFTIKCVVYGSFAARVAGIQKRINAVAGMGYIFAENGSRARLLRPLVRWLMRIAVAGRQARLILQNMQDCEAFLRDKLADEKHIRLIRGSGVNTHHFRPTMPLKQSGFRVILAARLLWDKGIQEYVSAALELKRIGLDIEFLLAGSPDLGNPDSVPQEAIRAWSDAGLITAIGHVEDMPTWFRQVDLAVLPSFYGEGVPRSLIEAAACGLPIITTDMSGCRDIVANGVNGLLVPARNAAALAEAIKFLYENPHKRAAFGAAGREKVLREFDETIVLKKTLDVYRELMPSELTLSSPGLAD